MITIKRFKHDITSEIAWYIYAQDDAYKSFPYESKCVYLHKDGTWQGYCAGTNVKSLLDQPGYYATAADAIKMCESKGLSFTVMNPEI